MSETPSGIGVVLAAYGRGALVLAGDEPVHCALAGRKLRVVCGDEVEWRRDANAPPTVHSVAPRRNGLERIDARGRAEPVAANIDRLAIVVAPRPEPDWFVVDRYWAAALQVAIDGLLIVNKGDLDGTSIADEIANYRRLGLAVAEVGCRTGAGIEDLRVRLAAGATVLVGQSGVGKSTLVNSLVPAADAQTAELTRDREGRHTTTTARRYRLGADAAIVDAPGVRDFAPPARIARAAERGFVEIGALSVQCRFGDCQHLREPGCAVRAAVDTGTISARRYESYRRLLRLYVRFATR
ncbi:MAG: ribosome small subunit-dependent GTPase A [Gammaproteobacteria bacterium]|nr:ribosome small subunit-dependent GTPase A [Gammaproteobacteria bacterium]